MTCIEMHCHFAMSLYLLSMYLAVRLISGPNAALIGQIDKVVGAVCCIWMYYTHVHVNRELIQCIQTTVQPCPLC